MNGHCRAYRNDAFFQAGFGGACGRGQCEIPKVTISAYFHHRVRARQADTAFDDSGEFILLVQVAGPTVMSQSRNDPEGKRKNDNACVNQES